MRLIKEIGEMKLKNIEIGDKVERKNPPEDAYYFITVTHLNEDANDFSGVVIHSGDNAPYELGDFIEGLHPKYFKSVQVH